MTFQRGVVQTAPRLHVAAVFGPAEEELVLRLLVGDILIGQLQRRVASEVHAGAGREIVCLLYTSPSPRD